MEKLRTTDEERKASEVVAEMLRRQYRVLADELDNLLASDSLPPHLQLTLGLTVQGALDCMYEAAIRGQTHADIAEMFESLDKVTLPLVDVLNDMPTNLRNMILNQIVAQPAHD